MAPAAQVRGLRELQRAFALGEKEISRDLRQTLAGVAEPVAKTAEVLAVQEISRIGPRWSRMRVGVTRRVVYVAPKERGVKSRGLRSRKRPNLAPKLMTEAMQPALDKHEPGIVREVEQALDRFADRWERR